jgi:cation transport ATPase
MDALISMGSLPPYLIGLVGFFYPMTSFIEMAATIMTFHLLGRYLETRTKGRASQAIRKLIQLGAKSARVERDGDEVEIPVSELRAGDLMVVGPGEKIPTDGQIADGHSHIDESIATGESVPVEKGPGAQVLGATINKEGFLKVRATRAAGRDRSAGDRLSMRVGPCHANRNYGRFGHGRRTRSSDPLRARNSDAQGPVGTTPSTSAASAGNQIPSVLKL